MYTPIVEECGNQLFERQGREESWPRQQEKLRRQGFSRTRASDNGSNWVIREPGIDQQQIEATGIGRNDERSHVDRVVIMMGSRAGVPTHKVPRRPRERVVPWERYLNRRERPDAIGNDLQAAGTHPST